MNNRILFIAPLSLLTASDNHNKRGQHFSRTRTTCKPKISDLHSRAPNKSKCSSHACTREKH
ncbi:hypothetical protein Hanom_Chr11g01063461 [Helianthus anomalus]